MTYFTLDTTYPIKIPSSDIALDGLLYVPSNAHGLVLFVHGSGSSRFSVRNQYVAQFLNEAKIATNKVKVEPSSKVLKQIRMFYTNQLIHPL